MWLSCMVGLCMQDLFKNSSIGGIYKKGPYYILSVERWQMVVGNKKFSVVSYVIV
jgi:hypothetical protein